MKTILQILLFSLAPFFVYPWKPFINIFAGKSYDIALKHFKAGHVSTVNLVGHLVCLIFCIFGNFAMLYLLDGRIGMYTMLLMDTHSQVQIQNPRILSMLSAIVWIGILIVTTQAPSIVKMSSTILIGLAYRYAHVIPKDLFEQLALAGLIVVIIGTNIFAPRSERIKLPLGQWMPKLLLAPGIYCLFQSLSHSSYAGSQTDEQHVVAIIAGTLGLLAFLSATSNPVKRVVITGIFLCRVAYILTGDSVEELFYLSCGFTSSLYQGICHLVTDEEPTLIAHGKKGAKDELALEYAHVVYFPNMTLETIYNKMREEPSLSSKSKVN